jgi:hypothetical protein
VCAARVLSVLWPRAVGWGHLFWGGLAVLGLVGTGAMLVASLETGLDPGNAVEVWWSSGWGPMALAAVACGVVAIIVRRVSRRGPAGHDSSEAQAASQSWPAPGGVGAAGPPGLSWAAIDAQEAAGREGELRIRELLLDRLPAGMLILNNLELPGLGGNVDLLIVGGTGLYLAEVKAWSGAISCSPDGRRWVGLPRAASGVHCPIRRPRPSGKFELCETTYSTRILTFVAAPNCGSTASSCSPTRGLASTLAAVLCRRFLQCGGGAHPRDGATGSAELGRSGACRCTARERPAERARQGDASLQQHR